MYAIVFDLDTEVLKEVYPGQSWNNADADIQKFLTARNFEWVQGSTYFGDETIDAVKTVIAARDLAAQFSWFKPAVRDIRMLRIEENSDLSIAL